MFKSARKVRAAPFFPPAFYREEFYRNNQSLVPGLLEKIVVSRREASTGTMSKGDDGILSLRIVTPFAGFALLFVS